MSHYRLLTAAFLRPWRRSPVVTATSVLGVAAGTAMLLAMGSANLRVLDSLKETGVSSGTRSLWNPAPSQDTNRASGAGGAHRIWRARHGQLPASAFDHCLQFLPGGVQCLGLTVRHTREVWREDARARSDLPPVTLVAVAGSPFEIISPMISPALVPHASRFINPPVATFTDPDVIGGRPQDLYVLVDHDSSGFSGHASIEASVESGISRDAAEKILDQMEAGFGAGTVRVDPDAEFETRKSLTASYRLNLSILGLMSVLVSSLLLRNTAALQMMLRRPVVAVLRQTGASRGTIMKLVLSEQILVAAAGCVVGIVGGILLEQAVSNQVMKTVRVLYTPDAGSGQRSLSIPVTGAAAAGLLVYLASSFAMLRGLVAIQPRDLAAREFEGRERQTDARRVARGWRLRALGIAVSAATLLVAPAVPPAVFSDNLQVPLFGYFAAMAIVTLAFSAAGFASFFTTRLLRSFVPARSAHRFPALTISTRRNLHARRRPEAAVATLATGLALVTGISLMVAGFRNSFTAWLAKSFTAEVVVLPLVTQDGESRPRLDGASHNQLRGTMQVVTDCVLLDEGTVTAPGNQAALKAVPVRVAGIDDALPSGYPAPLEILPWPGTKTLQTSAGVLREFMGSNELFLASEALARKLKLAVGDEVQLAGVKAAGSHRFTGRIAGVVRDYSSELGYIFMAKKNYEAHTGLDGCHSLRIYTGGPDAPAFAAAVGKRLPEIARRLNIQSSHELKKMATGTFEQTFKVTGLLTILAAILGGVALIVQIAQSSAGRRLEWLALRRLGASWSRLTQLLAADVLISVLAGLGLGLVCGGIMAWLLVVVINRQAFGCSIAMPGFSDLATAGLFALAYAAGLWLAGVFMSWWTMRPGKAWEVLRE